MTESARQIIEQYLLGWVAEGLDITKHVRSMHDGATAILGTAPDLLEFNALVHATALKASRADGMQGMRETREGRPA